MVFLASTPDAGWTPLIAAGCALGVSLTSVLAIWSKRSGKERFPQALLGHLFAILAVAAIAFGLRAIGVFQIEWARGMNDAFDPAQAAGDFAYLAMSDVWFAAIVAFGSLMGVVAAFVPERTGLEGGAVE